MRRSPSAAQRAVQITFVLKGHLKNIQLSYLRAATLLVRMRDEKLYRALKHDTLEDYAAARLGLQRTALYRYLQIYDWVRESHPAWLARRPKGFIPELTDAHALMWIERRLRAAHLGESVRRDLETLRRKALAGKLAKREFDEFRKRGRPRPTPLEALLAGLRAVRRLASSPGGVPQEIVDELDGLIHDVQRAIAGVMRGKIAHPPRRAAARQGRRAGAARRRPGASRRRGSKSPPGRTF
jgi:hypothetical protein